MTLAASSYPEFQRLFMGGFQFRSSLKKWPARKASGPEGHPFDSAEPVITLLTSRIWMFCWLVPWKITAVPVTTWHDVVCKKGAGRQQTTFTSCQNAACSNEFFLWRVDYDWANVHYFVSCFILRGRETPHIAGFQCHAIQNRSK